MNVLLIISFFVYVSILVAIGWFFSRRQKSSSDFMVGGRTINYWVTAIATQATDMSAWLFMAFPAAVYDKGLYACWTAIGLFGFTFLTWQFVAEKLRRATEKFKSLTLSSYLEKRFNDTSGLIRIISATFALFFFSLYISAGIVALGRALQATFGFTYHTSITIGTLTIALYTLLGGFIAIAWNDFLQGMFVFVIMVTFPLYALHVIGGFPVIAQAALAKGISLSLLPDFSFATLSGAFVMALGWGIGLFGQPHILVNFMGIDDPNNIRKAKYVGLSWQAITLSAAVLIGLIGVPFFGQTTINSEHVFINMVKVLFNPLFAGIILCAILAAAVSTMDSQILVSASMLSQDLYKKLFHRDASPERLLTMSRIGGIIIVLFSYLLAFGNKESIFSLVLYAWGGLGSTFGAVILLSLYSKKITRNGALTGIIVGGITGALWKYTGFPFQEYAAVPGFALSMLTAWVVSHLPSN